MARRGQATSQQRQPAPPPKAPPPAVPPASGAVAAGAGSAAGIAAAAIASLLISGVAGLGLLIAAKKALASIASAVVIAFLLAYAFTAWKRSQRVGEPGRAEAEQVELQAAYRAWYIVNAAARLSKAEANGEDALSRAESIEPHYFNLHLRAMDARLTAARGVDEAAARFGDLLGWKATMDSRTTMECRQANGKNFRADREPVIGWPGSVHPHCRCLPTRPFPGAPTLPAI